MQIRTQIPTAAVRRRPLLRTIFFEQLVHENGSTFNVNLNTGGNSGTTTTATVDITTVFENLPTAVAYWVSITERQLVSLQAIGATITSAAMAIDRHRSHRTVNNVSEPVPVTVTIDASGGVNTDGSRRRRRCRRFVGRSGCDRRYRHRRIAHGFRMPADRSRSRTLSMFWQNRRSIPRAGIRHSRRKAR